jgi:hypothetical protein
MLATAVNTRYMGTGSMADQREAATLLGLLDAARRSRDS